MPENVHSNMFRVFIECSRPYFHRISHVYVRAIYANNRFSCIPFSFLLALHWEPSWSSPNVHQNQSIKRGILTNFSENKLMNYCLCYSKKKQWEAVRETHNSWIWMNWRLFPAAEHHTSRSRFCTVTLTHTHTLRAGTLGYNNTEYFIRIWCYNPIQAISCNETADKLASKTNLVRKVDNV